MPIKLHVPLRAEPTPWGAGASITNHKSVIGGRMDIDIKDVIEELRREFPREFTIALQSVRIKMLEKKLADFEHDHAEG